MNFKSHFVHFAFAGLMMAGGLFGDPINYGSVELNKGETWVYSMFLDEYSMSTLYSNITGGFEYRVNDVAVRNDSVFLQCTYRDSLRKYVRDMITHNVRDTILKAEFDLTCLVTSDTLIVTTPEGASPSSEIVPRIPPFLQSSPNFLVESKIPVLFEGQLHDMIKSRYMIEAATWVESAGIVYFCGDNGTAHSPAPWEWTLTVHNGKPVLVSSLKLPLIPVADLLQGDTWQYAQSDIVSEGISQKPNQTGDVQYTIDRVEHHGDTTILSIHRRDSTAFFSKSLLAYGEPDSTRIKESALKVMITDNTALMMESDDANAEMPPFLCTVGDYYVYNTWGSLTDSLVELNGQRLRRVQVDYAPRTMAQDWLQGYGVIATSEMTFSDAKRYRTLSLVNHNGTAFSAKDLKTALRNSHGASSARALNVPAIGSLQQLKSFLQTLPNNSRASLWSLNGQCVFQTSGAFKGNLPMLPKGQYVLSMTGVQKMVRTIMLSGR